MKCSGGLTACPRPLSPLTDLHRASMPKDSESDTPASDMVHYTSRKTGQFAAQALKHSTVLQNNCAILASMNDQLYFLVGVSRSRRYFVGIHKNELTQPYSGWVRYMAGNIAEHGTSEEIGESNLESGSRK